ncbi:BZ3500_MvSof-1268-A1-R1_Chr2-3g05211 [Microbotryum saponariae]|uniref:BZ3500_MvSof-1268-A1-R1_Chr2-3g05211 protein n=1 Tax=Microbotryum saponariae TaxID=289078 RepID=A0A2X0N855_9BASI|nr:BZ3500_MvSof-1268-A1-R1_Chr2-3g05211 [Microbotryum saponariae]SDA01037.1 BZ3501_MvSof-1269-A2-R1_Chr2-2g04884 [Microbotryum saponariae]
MSKTISRPLQRYPTAFAACATQLADRRQHTYTSLPSTQAMAYGKCIGAKYTEVERGMCEKEFQAFKACVAQHVKRK